MPFRPPHVRGLSLTEEGRLGAITRLMSTNQRTSQPPSLSPSSTCNIYRTKLYLRYPTEKQNTTPTTQCMIQLYYTGISQKTKKLESEIKNDKGKKQSKKVSNE